MWRLTNGMDNVVPGRDWSILFLALAVLLFVLVVGMWVVRVKAETGPLPAHAKVIHASARWPISN